MKLSRVREEKQRVASGDGAVREEVQGVERGWRGGWESWSCDSVNEMKQGGTDVMIGLGMTAVEVFLHHLWIQIIIIFLTRDCCYWKKKHSSLSIGKNKLCNNFTFSSSYWF